jgi:uncharacterized membrane protein
MFIPQIALVAGLHGISLVFLGIPEGVLIGLLGVAALAIIAVNKNNKDRAAQIIASTAVIISVAIGLAAKPTEWLFEVQTSFSCLVICICALASPLSHSAVFVCTSNLIVAAATGLTIESGIAIVGGFITASLVIVDGRRFQHSAVLWARATIVPVIVRILLDQTASAPHKLTVAEAAAGFVVASAPLLVTP